MFDWSLIPRHLLNHALELASYFPITGIFVASETSHIHVVGWNRFGMFSRIVKRRLSVWHYLCEVSLPFCLANAV
jgi:hypothetical protein